MTHNYKRDLDIVKINYQETQIFEIESLMTITRDRRFASPVRARPFGGVEQRHAVMIKSAVQLSPSDFLPLQLIQ